MFTARRKAEKIDCGFWPHNDYSAAEFGSTGEPLFGPIDRPQASVRRHEALKTFVIQTAGNAALQKPNDAAWAEMRGYALRHVWPIQCEAEKVFIFAAPAAVTASADMTTTENVAACSKAACSVSPSPSA